MYAQKTGMFVGADNSFVYCTCQNKCVRTRCKTKLTWSWREFRLEPLDQDTAVLLHVTAYKLLRTKRKISPLLLLQIKTLLLHQNIQDTYFCCLRILTPNFFHRDGQRDDKQKCKKKLFCLFCKAIFFSWSPSDCYVSTSLTKLFFFIRTTWSDVVHVMTQIIESRKHQVDFYLRLAAALDPAHHCLSPPAALAGLAFNSFRAI